MIEFASGSGSPPSQPPSSQGDPGEWTSPADSSAPTVTETTPETPVALAPRPRPNAEFFIVDYRRIPISLLFRGSKPWHWPLVVIVILITRLGIKVNITTNRPAVDSLLPFEIDPAQLSSDETQNLRKAVADVEKLGWGEPIWFRIEDLTTAVLYQLVVMVHRETGVIAFLFERFWFQNLAKKSMVITEFVSPLSNGNYMVTTNLKFDEEAGKTFEVQSHEGKAADKLWALHQKRLGNRDASGAPIKITSPFEAVEKIETYHRGLIADMRQLGTIRPMNDKEKDLLRTSEKSHDMLADRPTAERMAFAHMNAPRSSWSLSTTVAVLVLSLLAFVAVKDSIVDTWKHLAIIVGIIFVHELGHYLAMMLFGYRDLKMFFIPGLGAAVTGKPVNPTAWKRSAIALAGPLPGIVLGGIFGVFGIIRGQELLIEICVMSLIINGFNLLPLLPFDGGHVLHATLFSRNYVFDVIFRAIAAVCLVLIGIGLSDTLLVFIGVVLFMGLRPVVANGKITQELRRKKFQPIEPPEGLSFSAENARIVLPQVVSAHPKASLKQHGEFAQAILNDIQAKPPGILASLGILGLHGGAFLLAFVSLVVMGIAHSPLIQSAFMAGVTTAGWDSTKIRDVQTWAGTNAGPERDEARVTIIGQAATEQEAQAQFAMLKQSLPPEADLLQMGKTLLVGLPADQAELHSEWIAKLQPSLNDLRVDSPEQKFALSWLAMYSSKSHSEAVSKDFDYLGRIPTSHLLIPPWALNDPRSAEQVERDRIARATYARLTTPEDTVPEDQRRALYEKQQKAMRLGDKAAIEETGKALRQLNVDNIRKWVEKVRAEPGMDERVCDAYMETSAEVFDFRDRKRYMEVHRQRMTALREKMLPLMGPMPEASSETAAALCRNSSLSQGWHHVNAEDLDVRGSLMFLRPTVGIPAMLRWLESRNPVHAFRFEFSTFGAPVHQLEDGVSFDPEDDV